MRERITNYFMDFTQKSPVHLVLLLLCAIVIGYLFIQYQLSSTELMKTKENAKFLLSEENRSLLGKLGSLIELPKNEVPTIATVIDAEKLKSQDFFSKSQNGDRLLLYPNAKRAYLYRPSTNRLIEVAPLNVNQPGGEGTQVQTVKIALLNGTDENGLTNDMEKKLKEMIRNAEISSKEKAKKSDYGKTIIVDLNGKLKEASEQLAKLIGAEVGNLPEGEQKPANADLLIIVGKK